VFKTYYKESMDTAAQERLKAFYNETKEVEYLEHVTDTAQSNGELTLTLTPVGLSMLPESVEEAKVCALGGWGEGWKEALHEDGETRQEGRDKEERAQDVFAEKCGRCQCMRRQVAMRSILGAMAACHHQQWVLNDVRWANIVKMESGFWCIIDCEFARRASEPFPEQLTLKCDWAHSCSASSDL
jgi:hypothetical protein